MIKYLFGCNSTEFIYVFRKRKKAQSHRQSIANENRMIALKLNYSYLYWCLEAINFQIEVEKKIHISRINKYSPVYDKKSRHWIHTDGNMSSEYCGASSGIYDIAFIQISTNFIRDSSQFCHDLEVNGLNQFWCGFARHSIYFSP